jgi:hypothetical protein
MKQNQWTVNFDNVRSVYVIISVQISISVSVCWLQIQRMTGGFSGSESVFRGTTESEQDISDISSIHNSGY